MGVSLVQLV